MGVLLSEARRSVTSWCRRNTIGGDGAVAAIRRGQSDRPDGLSRAQELELIDVLRGTYPEQFGLTEQLWTRESLAALIQRRYQATLSPAGVGDYLRAWGIGPRKPTERACSLCVDSVGRWLASDYPSIEESARVHHAGLYWVGRTRLYGVVPALDILSAVSTQGQVQFVIAAPTADQPLVRDFLLRLSGREGRSVHVVVDGSWTRAEWPRRLPARIVPYALPSCGRAA